MPAILLPNLGYATSEGTVLNWLQATGDTIEQGQPLVEIASEKTVNVVASPQSGVLLAVYAQPGAIIAEGEPLGWVGKADESPPRLEPKLLGWEEEVAPAPGDLVQRLKASATPDAPTPGEGPSAESPGASEKQHRSVLRGQLRRITAQRMARSWQEAPKVDLFADVEMTQVQAHRKSIKDSGLEPPSFNIYITQAVVKAFQDLPGFNMHLMEGLVIPLKEINVGLAVALGDNLVTVSMKNLAGVGLMDIQRRFKGLIKKALRMSLSRDELYGSSLTVTNLGEFDITAFTAVLNPPEVFILAIGKVEDRVVARNGKPEVAPMCTFVLSFDHRAVDGAPASRLLQRIKTHMEAEKDPI